MRKALGIAAHPDDLEWYAGATIAKLVQEGTEMCFVICTDGDKGTYDPGANSRQLAVTRQSEQRRAASLLGVQDVIFVGESDGELKPTPELERMLVRLYRSYQPDLLLAFDPWKKYELHPDHIAAGKVALDARLGAKMPMFFPELRKEGLVAWTIPEIWLFNAEEPNWFVDVSATFESQRHALEAHVSQAGVWDKAARQFLEKQAQENGVKIGVTLAEAFRRIVIAGALVVAEGTGT